MGLFDHGTAFCFGDCDRRVCFWIGGDIRTVGIGAGRHGADQQVGADNAGVCRAQFAAPVEGVDGTARLSHPVRVVPANAAASHVALAEIRHVADAVLGVFSGWLCDPRHL